MQKISSILILTGAGVSAESGVPTFRDANGLWCNHRVEDVASPEAFVTDPELVQRFYNERRRNLLVDAVKPNKAHLALAKLQREFKGTVRLVTQNIDDLHERAGFKDVIHMHGELLKVRCSSTGIVYPWRKDVDRKIDKCECCSMVGTLRPHIVWFGEMPLFMDEISQYVGTSNLFVAIGTSGVVYPAAGLVSQAQMNGARTLELNLSSGDNHSVFQQSIFGKATEVVPAWVESMLDGSFEKSTP